MDNTEILKIISDAAEDKKAVDIEIMDVSDVTGIADYFFLATGRNRVQTRAVADEVEMKLKEHNIYPLRSEGYQSGQWILMDYGSVLVHVFTPEEREFYQLEDFWAEIERIRAEGEEDA